MKLTQLLSKMEGNDKLEQLLADVLSNTEKAKELAKQMGIDGRTIRRRAPLKRRRPHEHRNRTSPGRRRRRADRRGPQPARPGDRRDPAAEQRRGRTGPRITSGSSWTTPSSRARSSPRTSRPTSRPGSARSTRSSPPSSTRSCTTPTSRSSKSTWRGLHYLVHQSETGENLKIRVLNVNKQELFKDLEKAVEFDQSTCSRRSTRRNTASSAASRTACWWATTSSAARAEDVSLLKMISGVAAAAHAPFVANAGPKMFDFDSFTELANPRDLAKIFEAVEYAPWKSFRESEDSRYVALTMPRVLARLPYGEDFKRVDRVQLRGRGRRQGAQQLPLDGRGLGLRGADHRRVRQVRLDGPDPRRRGRRQGRGAAGAHLPDRRRRRGHEVPDRDRHLRPPRVRAVEPRLPAALAQQGERLRRLHGRAVVPEAEDLLRPGGQRQRRAVGEVQPACCARRGSPTTSR